MFRKLTNKLHITKRRDRSPSASADSTDESLPTTSESGSTERTIPSPKEKKNGKTFLQMVFRKNPEKKKKLKKLKSSSSETRKQSQPEQTSNKEVNDNLAMESWIFKCYSSPVLGPTTRVNQLFAPGPTMCSFMSLVLATDPSERDNLDTVFQTSGQFFENAKNRLKSRPKLLPRESFNLFRIIVDEEKDTLVNAVFLRLIHEHAGEMAVLSCRPDRVSRYLQGMTAGVVAGPRTHLAHTTIYCAGGVRARWTGQTGSHFSAPFAVTYAQRQKHPFFVLVTKTKLFVDENFEVWCVPVQSGTHSLSLVLIRPRHWGEIFEARTKLSPDTFAQIAKNLRDTKESTTTHRMLMPTFSLRLSEDISTQWAAKGLLRNVGRNVFPPIDGIWHSAVVSVDSNGIGINHTAQKNSQLPTSLTKYAETGDLLKRHYSYSARFDSPFMFMIMHDNSSFPLLAGSYAGSPAAVAKQICIPTPAYIQCKPPPLILKPEHKPEENRPKQARKKSRWSKMKRKLGKK